MNAELYETIYDAALLSDIQHLFDCSFSQSTRLQVRDSYKLCVSKLCLLGQNSVYHAGSCECC